MTGAVLEIARVALPAVIPVVVKPKLSEGRRQIADIRRLPIKANPCTTGRE